ncbi:hypothetical protein N657DRAFT_646338 [Parathielavia appendiculata]|uniref:Uncharacterized protein n=1 Tax=Parathielavia appendiculata TaxID=2587402 RepID=A0AAN6TZI0_9PEZI|nr:hypothetical protein N657DRAFT_646338 [Parathielavia appendiculata]
MAATGHATRNARVATHKAESCFVYCIVLTGTGIVVSPRFPLSPLTRFDAWLPNTPLHPSHSQ